MTDEELNKIVNDIVKENILNNLNSYTIFNYIKKLEQENQKQKEIIDKTIKLYKHRLNTANEFIESRKENMILEHYEDLKYILNDCDLESSW